MNPCDESMMKKGIGNTSSTKIIVEGMKSAKCSLEKHFTEAS